MRIILQLFAHHKGGGSTSNGRDSNGQRLGVKKFAGDENFCNFATRNDNQVRPVLGHSIRKRSPSRC